MTVSPKRAQETAHQRSESGETFKGAQDRSKKTRKKNGMEWMLVVVVSLKNLSPLKFFEVEG